MAIRKQASVFDVASRYMELGEFTDEPVPDELAAWKSLSTLLFKLPGVLDYQLQRDSALSHFEYLVLADAWTGASKPASTDH